MYTLNSTEVHAVCYGLEPGAATRMNWENRIHKELAPTLRQNMGDNQASVAVCYALDQQGGKGGANYLKDICPTILSDSHGTPHAVACIGIDLYNQQVTGEVSKTLNSIRSDSDHVPRVLVEGGGIISSTKM